MMMSPPRPPSPPSGPPMGTNFSRRNEVAPEPPVPASTRTTTRSMNTVSELRARSWGRHSREQLVIAPSVVGSQQIGDGVDGVLHLRTGRAGVKGAVEVRVELTVLSRKRARSDDAQLAAAQIERR